MVSQPYTKRKTVSMTNPIDWSLFRQMEREEWKARYSKRMPFWIKVRWFVAGFLEQQIQTMITERLLAYDHVSSLEVPIGQSNPSPPLTWQADQVEADQR